MTSPDFVGGPVMLSSSREAKLSMPLSIVWVETAVSKFGSTAGVGQLHTVACGIAATAVFTNLWHPEGGGAIINQRPRLCTTRPNPGVPLEYLLYGLIDAEFGGI